MKIYKVYEQFGDGVCYATEEGVINIANNDRTKEDGTEAEEFKDFESAKNFLAEEKLYDTDLTEFNSLEEAKEFVTVREEREIEETTNNYFIANY